MYHLFILGILTTTIFNLGYCSNSGGPCYMYSQRHCQQAWSNLWIAHNEKQYSKICKYFGDVHTCTMEYMKECKFLPQEKELYQNDIVKVYTKKPYSCELMGGNMRYSGQYSSAQMVKPRADTSFMTCFIFLNMFSYIFQ